MMPRDWGFRTKIDDLLAMGARIAGIGDGEIAALATAVLGPNGLSRFTPGGRSELNNDGHPLQLCLSQARQSSGTRLILDPVWEIGRPHERLEGSLAALRFVTQASGSTDLAPLIDAMMQEFIPSNADAIEEFPSAFFWLGVGLGQAGCAVYVDLRPFGQAAWSRTIDWLRETLVCADEAMELLDRIEPYVTLSSVGLEGVSATQARAKIYWRLRESVSLRSLGIPLLRDAQLSAFLAQAIQDRSLPVSGAVMSAGFSLHDGALDDVKIDLCAHCLPQSAKSWATLLPSLARTLGVQQADIHDDLIQETCEVAFVGAGVDRMGSHRMNIYLKPSGLPSAASDQATLRDRLAKAAAYLCSLQAEDGSTTDFRLPVGRSDQWVTAFTGFALATAGARAGLAWATKAAEHAADWLIDHQSYTVGWGFNAMTGPDADSTGFAMRLLRATHRSVRPIDNEFLLDRWCADGGIATYSGPGYWGEAHPCVTAAAFLALNAEDQQIRLPELVQYTQSCQLPDGTWPAYWWRENFYSTWHHLMLEKRLGRALGHPTANSPLPSTSGLSPFDAAYATGIAHRREPNSPHASRLLCDLLDRQRADGGWNGGFNLRVTDPSCASPWKDSKGDFYCDRAGSISTASAIFVLSEMLDD